jgi:hypothetical protein
MRVTLGVVLISVLLAAPAFAKHHWHDEGKHRDKHEAACYFQPREIEIIREYYQPRHRNLPPGLAKKFARTGQLPPGWQRKMEPLPVAVERQLVVLPPEYRRGYIDGTVVVYEPRTQVVVDIVALFGR